MSRHGEVTLPWGDGDYKFRLAYGELRDLQEACDAGPPWIADRLRDGNYRVEYIRETMRLALIGGGMSQSDALTKVRLFCEPRLEENRLIAWAIIRTALEGAADEKLGKAVEAVTKKKKASGFRGTRSPSQESTATVPQ